MVKVRLLKSDDHVTRNTGPVPEGEAVLLMLYGKRQRAVSSLLRKVLEEVRED